MTGIIVFDENPIDECVLIEQISRGLYDCGGSI